MFVLDPFYHEIYHLLDHPLVNNCFQVGQIGQIALVRGFASKTGAKFLVDLVGDIPLILKRARDTQYLHNTILYIHI